MGWQSFGWIVVALVVVSSFEGTAFGQGNDRSQVAEDLKKMDKQIAEVGDQVISNVKTEIDNVESGINQVDEKILALQATVDNVNKTLEEVASLRNGKRISGTTILLILFLGSYCVQRVSNFLIRMLGCLSFWNQWLAVPDKDAPKQKKEQYRIKLAFAYYLVAAVVSIGLVAWFKYATNNTPLLEGLISFTSSEAEGGANAATSFFRSVGDSSIMVLVLLIGADQIAQWILPNSQEGAEMVDVSGKLVLNEPAQ